MIRHGRLGFSNVSPILFIDQWMLWKLLPLLGSAAVCIGARNFGVEYERLSNDPAAWGNLAAILWEDRCFLDPGIHRMQ